MATIDAKKMAESLTQRVEVIRGPSAGRPGTLNPPATPGKEGKGKEESMQTPL